MKFYLLKAIKNVIKITLIIVIVLVPKSNIDNEQIITLNNNGTKTVELLHRYINYSTVFKNNYNMPLFTQKTIVSGEQGIVAISNNTTFEIKQSKDEVVEVGKAKIDSFVGALTGYGPDCVGCGGRVSCNSLDGIRQDVRNGNIYYNDAEYGKINIVAADASIPCGTIIEIKNFIFSTEPIKAIVLDRGGVIKGKKIDLLYSSEKETEPIGYQRNVTFDILRWNWNK